jgi:hypothetical protein
MSIYNNRKGKSNPSQPSTLSSPSNASSTNQNLPKSLSDLRKIKTKKEARLLTKADSACRKKELKMKRNGNFGGETETERIVVI